MNRSDKRRMEFSKKHPIRTFVQCFISDFKWVRKRGIGYLFLTRIQKRNLKHNIRNRKKYGAGFMRSRKYIRACLIIRDGDLCAMCNKKKFLTIDHIKMLKDGGTHAMSNLQLLCFECHTLKDHPNGVFAPFEGFKPFADLNEKVYSTTKED